MNKPFPCKIEVKLSVPYLLACLILCENLFEGQVESLTAKRAARISIKVRSRQKV